MPTLTSVSVAVLDVNEDLLSLTCVAVCVDKSAAGGENECVWFGLGDRGDRVEFSLGKGELEGVDRGEGCGERVPISMARSSVQARPRLRK